MKLPKIIALIIASSILGLSAFGAPFNIANDKEMMATAQKILPSTDIKKVMVTEIPNVLAVLMANEEVIYIYPPKELILVGEIYNKNGVNLTDKHTQSIGASKTSDSASLDVAPLMNIGLKMNEGSGKYGFVVFTDPDCPFCQQLENFILKQDVEVYYILMPIDALHPQAREKSIKMIMEKLSLTRGDAIKRLKEGEGVATGLGINGTPQTLVYEKDTKKPVAGISGADLPKFQPYISKDNK